MRCPAVAGLLLVAILASAAAAQDTPASRMSLKGLEGVALSVPPIAADAQHAGLHAETLQKAAAKQLQDARVRVISPKEFEQAARRPSLVLSVHTASLSTGEQLYTIHVELTQRVALLSHPEVTVAAAIPAPAVTWSSDHVLGIVPANQLAGQAQGAVAKMVEQFIDAFYKANPSEAAFEARRAR